MEAWEQIAYDFARRKHESQLDDDGITPYFNSHVLHVVAVLKCVTNDHDIITAAYLHDILEDTETKCEEIANLFGGRVAGFVYELTHEGKDSSLRRRPNWVNFLSPSSCSSIDSDSFSGTSKIV